VKTIKYLFERDRKPKHGLTWYEWAMMVYVTMTTVVALLMKQQLVNPDAIFQWRVQAVAMTVGLWTVYRLYPCRLTMLARMLLQVAMLGTWYPDVYEFNRSLPCLDHIFVAYEQQLFGCQPSLLFSKHWPSPVVSELVELGYSSYYFIIGGVLLWFFCRLYHQFERATFVVLASFFIYYTVYLFLPVVGPQYYFAAVGLDEIARGHFPDLGHYFMNNQDCLSIPGVKSGLFHRLVQLAHDAGERPTAAFPSSHVGVSTILMLLSWQQVSQPKGTTWLARVLAHRLFWALMPLFLLLCLGTVYIYAHYAIDVIGGLASAVALYPMLWLASAKATA